MQLLIVWLVGVGILLGLMAFFPKQVGAVVGVLLLFGVGLFIYVQYQAGTADRNRAQLSSAAQLGSPECTEPAYPVAVTITNGADVRLTRLGFSLEGRQPGAGSPRYARQLVWERVVPPQESATVCWGLDEYRLGESDPQSLEWSAPITSASFE